MRTLLLTAGSPACSRSRAPPRRTRSTHGPAHVRAQPGHRPRCPPAATQSQRRDARGARDARGRPGRPGGEPGHPGRDRQMGRPARVRALDAEDARADRRERHEHRQGPARHGARPRGDARRDRGCVAREAPLPAAAPSPATGRCTHGHDRRAGIPVRARCARRRRRNRAEGAVPADIDDRDRRAGRGELAAVRGRELPERRRGRARARRGRRAAGARGRRRPTTSAPAARPLPSGGDCEATPAGCQDFWEPTFPRAAPPMDPFAGTWHMWAIRPSVTSCRRRPVVPGRPLPSRRCP